VSDLASLASEQFSYLTTRGRRTGSAHEIEIWFALADTTVYMLHGSGMSSDSVRNLLAEPRVTVRIADRTFDATARVVSVPDENQTARRLLLRKYEPAYSGDLSNWGRTALPVAVDLQF
jgi:deazaflavin-dependent oxidoreductase (nitroreductase family)